MFPSFLRKILPTVLFFAPLAGVSAQQATQQFPTGLSYPTYYDQRRTLFAGLGVESTDIVMLGDALMDRGMWSESFGNPYIRNRGIDDDNLSGLAYRLDDVIKGRPAKIFIHIGKRDLNAGMSPSLAASYLGAIVERIHQRSRRTQVYVIGLYPDKNTPEALAEKYVQFNSLVEQTVPDITFVDISIVMTGPDGRLRADFSYGNSALNGRGYAAVVQALSPYLTKNVLRTGGIREDYPLRGFVRDRNSIIEYLPGSVDDILMIGNSITNGGEWAELFRDKNVKNRGISSDVSDGVLARLPQMLAVPPRKIFLMIGVNDMGNAPGKTPEQTVENVLKVVAEIRRLSPKTKLYVESLLPVNPTFPTFRSHTVLGDQIRYVNRALREAAARNGYTFIDLHRNMTDRDGHLDARYTNDGLHLTWEGYRKWRDILSAYMD